MITISVNTVAEGAFADIVVGQLGVIGLNEPVTYTIANDPTGGGFKIVGNKLVVNDGSLIDYEASADGLLNLEITANDGSNSEITDAVVIQVADLNEVTGSEFGEFLPGAAGDDLIQGFGGNDQIEGGLGSDVLDGGDGDDSIFDAGGNNQISGGAGNDFIQAFHFLPGETDTIFGGDGDDYIFSNGANVLVTGGDGNDYVDVFSATVTLGLGADSVVVRSGNGDGSVVIITDFDTAEDAFDLETLLGELQFRFFNLEPWNGTSNPFAAQGANVNPYLVLEADGADKVLKILREDGSPNGVYDIAVRMEGAAGATFTQSNFTPRIDPNGAPTSLIVDNGTPGDDIIFGTLGNDTLSGGAGSDRIFGSYGNDTITGGAGYNGDLSGGAGNDTITGGDDGNFIHGDDGDDILTGGSRDDVIVGGIGSDTIHAGSGNDFIDDQFNRPDDADVIYGDTGNDLINYFVDYTGPALVDAAEFDLRRQR